MSPSGIFLSRLRDILKAAPTGMMARPSGLVHGQASDDDAGVVWTRRTLSRAITAGRGGIMSYELNAVLKHISTSSISTSSDAVLDSSDTKPPACHGAPSTR